MSGFIPGDLLADALQAAPANVFQREGIGELSWYVPEDSDWCTRQGLEVLLVYPYEAQRLLVLATKDAFRSLLSRIQESKANETMKRMLLRQFQDLSYDVELSTRLLIPTMMRERVFPGGLPKKLGCVPIEGTGFVLLISIE